MEGSVGYMPLSRKRLNTWRRVLLHHGFNADTAASPGASALQTAFFNEALPDRRNVRLGIGKRLRRCVDRVVAEDEIVLVRSGRAENEIGRASCRERV